MSGKILVLIFVFVFLNGELCDDSLSPDDDHVCATTVKELRNFNVTFTCKTKKRCKRIEQKSVSVLKYICCLGWKSCNGKCIKESDVCVLPECVNGIYKDRNCTCDLGLVHLNETHCGPKCTVGFHNDLTTTNFTCVSKCSEPCVNGIYTDFDTCTCDPGLVKFNETHCGSECTKGFHNDLSVSSLPCVPDCSQPCINAICTDIEICTCEPDLVHLNETHCGPECTKGFHNNLSNPTFPCISDCSQPCVNGICTGIDTCTCEPGLVNLNKTHCGPECTKGFHNNLSVASLPCVSDCSQPCVNAVCADIDTCTCEAGLVHLNETHCGPECTKGFHNNLSVASLPCIPDCSQPCINAICTDIETCICHPGLVHLNETHCGPECTKGFHNNLSDTSFLCISDCSQPCINAVCTDFETCICHPGLVHLNKTHCGPECTKGFHNNLSNPTFPCISDCSQTCFKGICTGIDTCTCEPGLVNLNKTHCGPECTKGFHNNISVASLPCVSDCSQPCVNAVCADIDTCTCDPGLVHLNETHCGPECTSGFHNNLSNPTFPCISDCSQPCVNGICTGIDTCTCEPGLVSLNKTHCGPECTKGFHNNLSDASLPCVSDCSQPCVNAVCTDIDTCTCDPGLVHLNETHCGPECTSGFHNNISDLSLPCLPDCSQPCVNGICTSIDTCTCDPGLVHLNKTHCAPECIIGFHNDLSVTSFLCVPDCSHPCVNAVCTDIDRCTCDPGLVHLNETHCGPECTKGFHNDLSVASLSCIPDCSQPCINAACTDIETCICYSGLVQLNKTHCGPECTKGFHNHLSVASLPCVPDCTQPCVNAVCTDIDTCTCEAGLVHLNETHCGPECTKGFHNNFSVASLPCIPDCSQPCINAICTDIETCICHRELVYLNETHCGPECTEGFHNDLSVTTFPCISDCSQPCVNAFCTEIDTCTCDPGLVYLNKTHCGPECTKGFHNNLSNPTFPCISDCSKPCVNGICISIDTCTCNPGFVYLNKTHCRPDCTKGFHNDLSVASLPCVPDCSQPCIKAVCTDIETCICHPGLVHLNKTHCGPECDKGFHNDLSVTTFPCITNCSQPCVNAVCTDIDTCTCNPGLIRLNETHCGRKCALGLHTDLSVPRLPCVSDCSQPCVNGFCKSLDTCTCFPGFIPLNKTHCGPQCSIGFHNDLSTTNFTCLSKCSRPCINGICIDFEKCMCNVGYREKDSSGFECEPECANCTNGVCSEPNECRCNKGYAKNGNDICEPVCSKPCVNGYCYAPDRCKCYSGYFYNETVKFCMAACKNPCVNSTCVSPDKCECWSGYIRSNVSNMCKPHCSYCSKGECIGPEVCRCIEGYKLHNSNCEQYHNEALSASYSWVPVCVVGILLVTAVAVIFVTKYLMKSRTQANDDLFGSTMSSTEMSMRPECKYKNNGGDDLENRLNNYNTDMPRVSSFDYIEKL